MELMEACFIGGADNQIRLVSSKMESQVPGWITPTQLPDPLPSAIDQWVEGIPTGRRDTLWSGRWDRELTRLMEGAYKSHREKSIVEV